MKKQLEEKTIERGKNPPVPLTPPGRPSQNFDTTLSTGKTVSETIQDLESRRPTERKEEELKEKKEEVQDLKIKFEVLGGEKAYGDYVRRKYGME